MGLLDRALDSSLLGYTKLGNKLRPHPPIKTDLSGQHIVVTGATSGLGLATARGLSALGATLTLVARNETKVARVVRELEANGGQVAAAICDLSSVAQSVALAAQLKRGPAIDVLIHNAGVLLNARTHTSEGLETSFATNLLAGFSITSRLMDSLSDGAHVISVSSGGMYTQRLRVSDLQCKGLSPWDGARAYAQHKRAQVVLTELWAARHPRLLFTSMHPGWADTAGVRTSLPTFHKLTKSVLRTPAEGADTIVWLAAQRRGERDPGIASGGFYHDRRQRPTHRSAKTHERDGERDLLIDTLAALERSALER